MSRLGWLGLLWLVLAACEAEQSLTPRTQVLVQVSAGEAIRQRAERLVVELARATEEPGVFEVSGEEVFQLTADFPWPASIALLPAGSDTPRFRVQATAYQGDTPLVVARVVSGFVAGRTLLLQILLEDTCLGFLSCTDTETCRGESGQPVCRDAGVDPGKLDNVDESEGTDDPPAVEDAGADAAVEAGDSAVDAASPDAGNCQPELCFNGLDDDCDQQPDCADPDCAQGALCSDDLEGPLGLVVSGSTCPPGTTLDARPLHQELRPGSCEGCSCGDASPTGCSAPIHGHTGTSCQSQERESASLTSFSCGDAQLLGYYNGLSVGEISAIPGSCAPTGSATPAAPSWSRSGSFCRVEARGVGCASGQVCVPRPASAEVRLCLESKSGLCTTNFELETWFTGVQDTRTCGACECEASGASCADVEVHFGHEYACGDNFVAGENAAACGYSHAPPARFVGSPRDVSCSPKAALAGQLAPSGRTAFCCVP